MSEGSQVAINIHNAFDFKPLSALSQYLFIVSRLSGKAQFCKLNKPLIPDSGFAIAPMESAYQREIAPFPIAQFYQACTNTMYTLHDLKGTP